VKLNPKERQLLDYFRQHVGELLTHEQILEDVWGWPLGSITRSSRNTLHVHVSRLREKGVRGIENVRNVGYRYEGG